MKKGITPLISNSGLEAPKSNRFPCIFGEFDQIPDESAIASLSSSDCVIKSES